MPPWKIWTRSADTTRLDPSGVGGEHQVVVGPDEAAHRPHRALGQVEVAIHALVVIEVAARGMDDFVRIPPDRSISVPLISRSRS